MRINAYLYRILRHNGANNLFQHSFNSILATQPFSLVTNQMLEITLNNFILDTHPAFYISFIAVALALCVVAVWRYRR